MTVFLPYVFDSKVVCRLLSWSFRWFLGFCISCRVSHLPCQPLQKPSALVISMFLVIILFNFLVCLAVMVLTLFLREYGRFLFTSSTNFLIVRWSRLRSLEISKDDLPSCKNCTILPFSDTERSFLLPMISFSNNLWQLRCVLSALMYNI